MQLRSSYPVLLVADAAPAARFFRTHFDFEVTYEDEWYISLKHGQWELAVLQAEHATIPEAYRGAVASGVLLNFEVEDVDAVVGRLAAAGLEPVQPLRSEDFGQRHAIFAGPGGSLIDVITPIPPSAEYAEKFSAQALDETHGGFA